MYDEPLHTVAHWVRLTEQYRTRIARLSPDSTVTFNELLQTIRTERVEPDAKRLTTGDLEGVLRLLNYHRDANDFVRPKPKD